MLPKSYVVLCPDLGWLPCGVFTSFEQAKEAADTYIGCAKMYVAVFDTNIQYIDNAARIIYTKIHSVH